MKDKLVLSDKSNVQRAVPVADMIPVDTWVFARTPAVESHRG